MSIGPAYQDHDAIALAELIASGEISAVELLEAVLAEAEAINPQINAITVPMHEEAGRVAAAGPKGVLAGVPFLLKDLGAMYKGAVTNNGSRATTGMVADHDTTLVERYRAAGLVIFGKTSTPEFGLNATTEPVLHGPCRNPYDLTRSTGGSSGGAAAAVAARLLPVAHATDGGGSIRIPAANCGLVGLKPTRARNPAGPDVGEGWSGLSTGHVVSRSVRDSAAFLDATHGPAPGDPYVAPPPQAPFLAAVGEDPGRLRIALFTHAANGAAIDPACVAGVEATGRLLEDLGHIVEPAAPAHDVVGMLGAMRTIIGANLRNLLDLREAMLGRALGPDDLENVTLLFGEDARRRTAIDYAHAIMMIHGIGRQLAAFFARYDLLLCPTLADPPLPLGRTSMMGDDLDAYIDALWARAPFTPLFNVTGAPAISLPLHWTEDGLPVGIHFGAPFGEETRLLRLAAQLEQARPWRDRRPPSPR